MRWKFWSRDTKENKNALPEVARLPLTPELAEEEPGAIERRMFVQSFCRSAKDVLGLQQLVGNQVLLQAFVPEERYRSTEGTKPTTSGAIDLRERS
jgi:hypothetical protein